MPISSPPWPDSDYDLKRELDGMKNEGAIADGNCIRANALAFEKITNQALRQTTSIRSANVQHTDSAGRRFVINKSKRPDGRSRTAKVYVGSTLHARINGAKWRK